MSTEAKEPGPPPPHLRTADSTDKECGNCSHYEAGVAGICKLYSNLPVSDDWLCDSWAKGSKPDPDAGEDETDDVPAAKQAQTLREANVRVRAHFRRRKAASPK
jgi:hypothetical protein